MPFYIYIAARDAETLNQRLSGADHKSTCKACQDEGKTGDDAKSLTREGYLLHRKNCLELDGGDCTCPGDWLPFICKHHSTDKKFAGRLTPAGDP